MLRSNPGNSNIKIALKDVETKKPHTQNPSSLIVETFCRAKRANGFKVPALGPSPDEMRCWLVCAGYDMVIRHCWPRDQSHQLLPPSFIAFQTEPCGKNRWGAPRRRQACVVSLRGRSSKRACQSPSLKVSGKITTASAYLILSMASGQRATSRIDYNWGFIQIKMEQYRT